MNLNYPKLLGDFKIPFTPSERGWVNLQCPMCDDEGEHGGFSPEGYYFCFKCGWHPVLTVLSNLLPFAKEEIKKAIRPYYLKQERILLKRQATPTAGVCRLPIGCIPFQDAHRKYLLSRNFNPDELEQTWGLKGTRHLGEYKFRIIAPIYFNGELVSYQGRDITGQASLRYKTCHKKDEVIHHKDIFYGLDYASTDKVIVCEGITDVWRFGAGAIATFGISVTPNQLLFLAKSPYEKIYVMFDTEPQAVREAEKLVRNLTGLGKEAELIKLDKGDPAGLSTSEAAEIKQDLLGY